MRPTARSYRSREASTSDTLPEFFPQLSLGRGRLPPSLRPVTRFECKGVRSTSPAGVATQSGDLGASEDSEARSRFNEGGTI